MEGDGSDNEGKNDFNPEEEIGIVATAKVNEIN
jgi:hypothetical protein